MSFAYSTKVKTPSKFLSLDFLVELQQNNYISAGGHEYHAEEVDLLVAEKGNAMMDRVSDEFMEFAMDMAELAAADEVLPDWVTEETTPAVEPAQEETPCAKVLPFAAPATPIATSAAVSSPIASSTKPAGKPARATNALTANGAAPATGSKATTPTPRGASRASEERGSPLQPARARDTPLRILRFLWLTFRGHQNTRVVSATMPAAKETSRMEYRTPLGCFDTWEDAATACERADLDPCTCIEIVPRGLC